MRQDRRTVLRHTAGLGWVSVCGGVAGCVGDGVDVGGTDAAGGAGTPGATPPLRPGTDLGLLFTGPGGLPSRSEVNPDEPGGGRLITVDDVTPGEQVTVSWRQTVERTVTPTQTPDAGVGTPTATPEIAIVEQTGTMTATGLAEAHEPLLPMFWEPGTTTTDTSAMWLSRDAFRDLRDTRRTPWSADPLTRISWVGEETQERIHDGVKDVDEVILEAEADFVDFELTVDTQRTTVQAIAAHDSFGNEYIIIADEENPLVVQFRYDAVSVGFSGFDTALWTLIKTVFSGYQVTAIESP